MAGLPGESVDDFLHTVRTLASLPFDGIKIHNLYFPKGTAVDEERRRGIIVPLSREDYALAAARALTLIPSSVVVHRLCADPAPGELAAPDWAADKRATLDLIHAVLSYNDWWQGKACDCPDANPFA